MHLGPQDFSKWRDSDTPAPELLYTMGDSPNLLHASYCGDMLSVMSLLQQGRVNVGFLGAAEVDRFGNLNTTWGSGTGNRCGCPVGWRLRHSKPLTAHGRAARTHPPTPRFSGRTYHFAGEWNGRWLAPRARSFLCAQGFGYHYDDGRAALRRRRRSLLGLGAPGSERGGRVKQYGMDAPCGDDLATTPGPDATELAVIRDIDPNHFWTKS